jgi:hypothetical protein
MVQRDDIDTSVQVAVTVFQQDEIKIALVVKSGDRIFIKIGEPLLFECVGRKLGDVLLLRLDVPMLCARRGRSPDQTERPLSDSISA